NYIPEEISKNIEKEYRIEISPYKSNEEAIAKILRKETPYDILIISNSALSSLGKSIKLYSINDITKGRKYISQISKIINHKCIPYLWSSTIFFNTSSKNVSSTS